MIVWNKVTWYSRYLALIFFTIVFPLWAFYLGTQYESAQTALLNQSSVITNIKNSSSTPIVKPVPTSTPTQKINSGIEGTVTIGPTCPVERIPPDPNCADKPYAAKLVAIDRITAKQIKFSASEDGTFKLDLPPGDYSIRNADSSQLPRMENYEMSVYPNKYTEFEIRFDSGIR